MREIAIVAGTRTAFTRSNKGSFKETRPDDLAMQVIRKVVSLASIDPNIIEDVILGCAMPEGEQGMNVARIASLLAGLPVEVPAMTINRFCSSGIQSMAIIADRIASGQMDVGIAGGVESMSMIPMTGNKLSLNPTLVDIAPHVYLPMGITAENVARKFVISRKEQDEFALRSHQFALKAQSVGFFEEEIVPVKTRVFEEQGVRETTVLKDDGPRADTDLERLALLKPAFDPTGSVTAGNSSPLTDGAAATLMMSADLAKKRGLGILGYFRSFAVAGVPPEIMGIGPIPAIRKLLAKTGLSLGQIDLFELNEAFASQAVYCTKELQIPLDRLNVNGGAIALGHPLGVTGTRLAITILRELKRRKGRYGIVSMCIGGGMGAAALMEAV